jgi:hypothetical protein
VSQKLLGVIKVQEAENSMPLNIYHLLNSERNLFMSLWIFMINTGSNEKRKGLSFNDK